MKPKGLTERGSYLVSLVKEIDLVTAQIAALTQKRDARIKDLAAVLEITLVEKNAPPGKIAWKEVK